jgi:hypothetical protein
MLAPLPRLRLLRCGMQNGTDTRRQNGHDGIVLMLLIIGALALVVGIAGLLRVTFRAKIPDHGWMSEKWLAEHRSTPPS